LLGKQRSKFRRKRVIMPKNVGILLVDDNEDILETLSDLLQEEGFYTETAKSGKEAIKKAGERLFNVVLLDIKLPDMTGIEVLKVLAVKPFSSTIIMMTGNATVQNAVDSINLGAEAYLIKPIDKEELLLAIKGGLKKQEIFNLRISQGMRKIPISISLSTSIVQKIDQEATSQKRSRSEYIELHFETYFSEKTLSK
jgi:DNA-binding response OmpR family regulator